MVRTRLTRADRFDQAALFSEFDDRQKKMLDEYLTAAETTLAGRAGAIANSYVGCSLAQGRELTGVLAALEGSPELEQLERESEDAYAEVCRGVLVEFAGASEVSKSAITAIVGAAEALSRSAVMGALIVAVVGP